MSALQFTDHYIDTNLINLHYIDFGGSQTPLVLLHGLTANAHAFDGLVGAGLGKEFRILCPDMRGRGLSSHPAFAYSVQEHAEDILGLLDSLKIDKVILGGHSYGGYISMYLAANYPERVEQLIILDAALEMNPRIGEQLAFSISRIGATYPSFDDYIAGIKQAPYIEWDDSMLSYYRADVHDNPDGTVTTNSNLMNIAEMSAALGKIDWMYCIKNIMQPTLLINGVDNYTLDEPLLPDYKAKETVALLKDAKYVAVDGNHHTMLYGAGAKQIVKAIQSFIKVEA